MRSDLALIVNRAPQPAIEHLIPWRAACMVGYRGYNGRLR
jgi:hypothetical protein